MSAVETVRESPLVGLGPSAEASPAWQARSARVKKGVAVGLLVGLQVAWLAAFVYAAFRFI